MYHKQWLMKSMIVLMTLATSLNMVSPAIQAAALPEVYAEEEISAPVGMEVSAGSKEISYTGWPAFENDVYGPSQHEMMPQSELLQGEIPPRPTFTCDDTVRIMPLGDSITYDNYSGDTRPSSIRTSYRSHLWWELQDNGYNVDFVGSVIAR